MSEVKWLMPSRNPPRKDTHLYERLSCQDHFTLFSNVMLDQVYPGFALCCANWMFPPMFSSHSLFCLSELSC